MGLHKNSKWFESYCPNHDAPNSKGLNFARIYLTFTSVVSIVLFQFVPHYSEAFKIFLNLIWYPGVNIGLTASAFLIGYDFFTKSHIKWKV